MLWRGWCAARSLRGLRRGCGVDLRPRLKFNLRCCKHADFAHVAEDRFDSRPVAAEILQLGFEWFAECDCCLGIVILFELPVDECKQISRLIERGWG